MAESKTQKEFKDVCLEMTEPAINAATVEAFKKATHSTEIRGIPETFITRFRQLEFQWLKKLSIDLNEILHAEQGYEFYEPLKLGDSLNIKTRLSHFKDRKIGDQRLVLIELSSEFFVLGKLTAKSLTTFISKKKVDS